MQLGRKLAEGYAVDNTDVGAVPETPRQETPQPETVTAERAAEPVTAARAQA